MFGGSFIKKLTAPKLSMNMFSSKPQSVVGIDIGTYSTKVVQLQYAHERAELKTYGELINAGYFKSGTGETGGGFLRYQDADLAELVKDVVHESNVTTPNAIFSIPATSSFVTTMQFPKVPQKEIEQSIPFEARKYIPIPTSEVVLDWDVIEINEEENTVEVLLVAVPKEVIEKIKRVSTIAGTTMEAIEIETFGIIRSLGRSEPAPTVFVNVGNQITLAAVAEHGKVRASHTFSRGSLELTLALERGLGVSRDRAETLKRDVGLSERIEEREITTIINPLVETLLIDIDRFVIAYNRKAKRKVQKVVLSGGGSNLKGLVELTASKFGMEVSRPNPFLRVVAPAFMQPVLRDIGPSFAVAVGLALREFTPS